MIKNEPTKLSNIMDAADVIQGHGEAATQCTLTALGEGSNPSRPIRYY